MLTFEAAVRVVVVVVAASAAVRASLVRSVQIILLPLLSIGEHGERVTDSWNRGKNSITAGENLLENVIGKHTYYPSNMRG